MITLLVMCGLALYLAWNVGANDVANAIGTSVGAKALTLTQALVMAGCLELAGALLFGQSVSGTLMTQVVDPALFADSPDRFGGGMMAVVLACGLWLNLATVLGLPVSSSHAVVGAIAGFGWVAIGPEGVAWSSIGLITIGWLLTPVASGAIAALFYHLIQRWILRQPQALNQLQEWIPWLSASLIGTFGILVLPTLAHPIQGFLGDVLGDRARLIPSHTIAIGLGAIALLSLTLSAWRAVAASPQQSPEHHLMRFQILSAGFVAFAHGANDVGNAVAPLGAIAHIQLTGMLPNQGILTPLWILALGGVGIVAGLALSGKAVITTISEGIIPLQPSSGLCAQLGTAATVLLASRLGLPVSTSHAIVGGIVGIALVQTTLVQGTLEQENPSLRWALLRDIVLAWVITIPIAALLTALIFVLIEQI